MKEHYEQLKQDVEQAVILACLIINTESQGEYSLSEEQQREIDENYYYLKYSLKKSGESARQFNRDI